MFPRIHRVVSPSVSPTSHSESLHVNPPSLLHPCSLMYILFPASRRADPSAVVALCPPPSPTPSRPPSNQLPVLYHGGHPSLPTYLRRSQPMRAEGMVSKHQWGNFFMCIKLFRTLCWVALSVSPGLREESNSPERERESVRGLRESECERRGGCHFFFFKSQSSRKWWVKQTAASKLFKGVRVGPSGPLRLM